MLYYKYTKYLLLCTIHVKIRFSSLKFIKNYTNVYDEANNTQLHYGNKMDV